MRSVTSRQRDLIVVGRSSAAGAHSSHTVRGAGSSIAFSSALAACSVARSASSNSTTRQPPDDRRGGRLEHQVPGLAHPVGQPVRPDQQQVGVRADRDLAAGRAVAAALLAAQQRGGEGPGRDRAARARRPGEQPGVRHAGRPVRAMHPGRGRGGRPAELPTTASCPISVGKAPGRPRSIPHRRDAAGGLLGRHRHRVGQQVAHPAWISRLSSAGSLVASRTRYRSGSAWARARNPARTRSWNSVGSASSRSADRARRPSPTAGRQVQQDRQVGLAARRSPTRSGWRSRRSAAPARRPGRPAWSRRSGR